ncbi:MAG: L-2-amino-thiazoline-4-carboxylic acid hydrolase [Candidatus Binatia bacterium]
MDVPFLEQVKIQAQVLVPLIQAFQAEFGRERTNAIVPQALWEFYRKFGEQWFQQTPGEPTEKIAAAIDMFAAGDAIDVEELRRSPEAFDFNITGCRYAQFFKALGVPELGYLLVCSIDPPMTEGYGGDVELTRTQTIMQGATHCDFRYRIKPRSNAPTKGSTPE